MASKENYGDKKGDKVDILSHLVDNLNLARDKNNYERDNYKVPDWIISYECPFLWHSEEVRGLGPEIVIARHLEKLEDLKIDDPDFCVQRFITMLKLVVEYYVTDQMLECWANMDEAEAMLDKARCEVEVTGGGHEYAKIKRVLDHVVYATKAHLLALHGQVEEAKQILKTITIAEIFNDEERASLYSIKARYFLYSGYENGENIAGDFSKKALELEPDNPEWAYLKAKILRQKRKGFLHSVEVPRDELTLLERAVKNGDDVKFKVYLAQVYMECAANAVKVYRDKPDFFKSDMYKTIEQFQTTALDLYKKTLQQNPDSPSVLRRVGYGIMNLPKRLLGRAEYDLVLHCLLRSLELSENQMTLHVLGTYYFRHGNDNEKALEYFEKTIRLFRSHAGLCDKVRIKFLMNPDYDPVPDLKDGLQWELKKANRLQLNAQLGTYFLFVKRDLIKSIETFNQTVEDEENIPHLKAFKSLFLRMYNPINLFRYLANECLLSLRRDGSELTDGEEKSKHESDLNLVQQFYQKIIKLDPESADVEVDPELIDDLLKLSKDILDKENRRNHTQSRGYSSGRARGNFPMRGGRGYRGGSFYDSRNRYGEDKEWRGTRGRDGSSDRDTKARGDGQRDRDNNYGRDNRYQRQRGQYRQYRGRDMGPNAETDGERDVSGDTDRSKRDENNFRQNNRYQRQRGQHSRQADAEGSGRNSETNWRQK